MKWIHTFDFLDMTLIASMQKFSSGKSSLCEFALVAETSSLVLSVVGGQFTQWLNMLFSGVSYFFSETIHVGLLYKGQYHIVEKENDQEFEVENTTKRMMTCHTDKVQTDLTPRTDVALKFHSWMPLFCGADQKWIWTDRSITEHGLGHLGSNNNNKKKNTSKVCITLATEEQRQAARSAGLTGQFSSDEF